MPGNVIPDSMSIDDYFEEKRADELMQRKFASLHFAGRPVDVLEFEQSFKEWKLIFARLHKRDPVTMLPLVGESHAG